MSEHVAKILQMTRLETGAIALDRDWASLAEIVGTVLDAAGRAAGARTASSSRCPPTFRSCASTRR